MGDRGGCIIEIGPQRHRRASGDLHRELSFLRLLVLWFRCH
jgi:hypothetical protein